MSAGAQRILPDGCLDLLFDGERLLVAGPDTTARVHTNDRPVPMHGVRLHAGRGPRLLGVPADELHDRTLPLDEVWGDRRARELTERVAAAPRRALAAWARSGCRTGSVRPSGRCSTVGCRWPTSPRRPATAPASCTAGPLPVFGYGPQHLARVLRLVRALRQADAGRPWSEVAQRAGYADQAHLARDVRALAGVTPTGLRHERVRSVQDAG